MPSATVGMSDGWRKMAIETIRRFTVTHVLTLRFEVHAPSIGGEEPARKNPDFHVIFRGQPYFWGFFLGAQK